MLRGRLQQLVERTGDVGLRQLTATAATDSAAAVDTGLMAAFQRTGDPEVFALLFERAQPGLRRGIAHRLHRGCGLDVDDLVQDVFCNIYRYPQQFVADQADAFRKWSSTIAHNVVHKAFAQRTRLPRPLADDAVDRLVADARTGSPDEQAARRERAADVDRAYLLFLSLYLVHHERLSAREREALRLVEVVGRNYRDAAAELGVTVANFKMLVFRGRQRILRAMNESLAALERGEFSMQATCRRSTRRARRPGGRSRSDLAVAAATAHLEV